jgi:hypothetical protein
MIEFYFWILNELAELNLQTMRNFISGITFQKPPLLSMSKNQDSNLHQRRQVKSIKILKDRAVRHFTYTEDPDKKHILLLKRYCIVDIPEVRN